MGKLSKEEIREQFERASEAVKSKQAEEATKMDEYKNREPAAFKGSTAEEARAYMAAGSKADEKVRFDIWLDHFLRHWKPNSKDTVPSIEPRLDKLFGALAKAQGEMHEALKTKENKFFDSMYADYADIWRVIQKPLADNELTLMHWPVRTPDEAGVRTWLGHSSGQYLDSTLTLPVPVSKDGTRTTASYGSIISYCKRFQAQNICNVAADENDDDAQVVDHPKIDKNTALETIARLEALGPRQVARFCTAMEIETVHDLTIEAFEKADALIRRKETSKPKEEAE